MTGRTRHLVIGIGSGSVGHLTGDAVAAMREVDVFVVAAKAGARELAEVRRRLCDDVLGAGGYRLVEVPDPPRDRTPGDYGAAVADWHVRRAAAYAGVLAAELPAGGTAGFLVWGDPALYDSTIRLVEQLAGDGDEVTVVPGISSVSLLAARHRIVLNRVGQPVHVTTGRRLVAEYDPGLGDVVVVLDGDLACTALAADHPDLQVYWGAQLGLPSERLVAGRLADVAAEIAEVRARVRQADGWVLDTYLLRPAG